MQFLSTKKKTHWNGFTLVEIVLYVSLFVLLSTLSINTLLTSIRAFNDLRISRDINDSSVKIMERLTRDIKSARTIDFANSTFNATPGRLTLSTVNASGTPMTIEYYVSSSTLRLRENGVDVGSLMSAQTRIDALVFRYLNNITTTGIKIELHVSSSRGTVNNIEHFYDTVIMRGTY